MENKQTGLSVSRIARLLAPLTVVGLALVFATQAWGTPPIAGPSVGFGGDNNVSGNAVQMKAVIVVDLDNDGDLDLVTSRESTNYNEVRAWRNDGTPFSGTWSETQVGETGQAANALAAGDLDHDGYVDLVAGGTNANVCIFKGNSTPFAGTWPITRAIGAAINAVNGLAVADFDHDGNLDIVSVSGSGSGAEVKVWENPYSLPNTDIFDEDWTAHDVVTTTIDKAANSVAVGDVDRDGYVDIVVGYGTGAGAEVVVWENTHDSAAWTFTARNVNTAALNSVRSVALGDMDRDGYLDIVEGDIDNQVMVWEATSVTAWTFSSHVVGSSLGDDVNSVAVADLDDDGYLDLAAGANTGAAFELMAFGNDADAAFDWSFAHTDVATATTNILGVAAGDLDGDGDVDLATARDNDTSGSGYEVAVWKNILPHRNAPFDGNGHGLWVQDTVLAAEVGDLDGDGDLDAVAAGWSGQIGVGQNDGTPFSGTWGGGSVGTIPGTVLALALGDLDGDGDLDIASGGWHSTTVEVAVWQNDGTPFNGPWLSNGAGDGAADVYDVALGDLDNDGDLDIVSGSGSDEDYEVIAWENDGTPFAGGWPRHDVATSTTTVAAVALGDLDNDGDLDIVAGSVYTSFHYNVSVLRNDGTPFDDLWVENAAGYSAADVLAAALGDLDGDGDLDIITGSGWDTSYEIIVRQNDGTPFTNTWAQTDVGDTDGSYDVSPGDLDNDGDLDIVSAGTGPTGQEVVAWFNSGTPFGGGWIRSVVGSNSSVYAATPGDLDNDGDLDILSGSWSDAVYEVMAWKNVGGSAGLFVSDTSPATSIPNGTEDDVLQVVFAHDGISGDENLELNRFDLRLTRSDCTTALTGDEANAIIDNLRVRLDDGDGVFSDTADALVADVADLNLTNGVQMMAFTDGDSRAWVTATATISRTYWVSAKATADAGGHQPNVFCMIFDPDADALVEAKSPDFSVSIQDTEPTDTGGVPTVVRLSSLRAAGRGAALPLVALLVLAGAAIGLLQCRLRARVKWRRRST
jgi:hypothetical protein